MKVLFQSEQLNYRGTTNSIVDYAHYNQEILGNESVLIYNRDNPPGVDVGSEEDVIEELSKKFQVRSYGSEKELNDIAESYDLCYSQRSGMAKNTVIINVENKLVNGSDYLKDGIKQDAIVTSTKFGVHVVFQWHGPHGDVYAYISEWLSKEVKKNYGVEKDLPFVPYIVNMPEPTRSLREELGIPKDKFIIGRLGGYDTFDLPFVWEAVKIIAETRDDVVFLFPNTMPFMNHKNVVFMDPFFDQQRKSNFIHTCDAMLHGRNLGESFGLAISEFLYQNKPVISWEGGFDKNHVNMLKPYDLLYTKETAFQKIMELPDLVGAHDYKKIVEPFTPKNVMNKFKEVFIDVPRT